MLALDQADRGSGPIAGLVGISGAYDLRPLLRTSINGDLTLSVEEAEAVSPLLRLRALPPTAPLMPLLAMVGGDETNGFKTWSSDLVDAWQAHGAAGHAGGNSRPQSFHHPRCPGGGQRDVARTIRQLIGP